MSDYHTPKKPTEKQLQVILDNFQYDPVTGILYRYKSVGIWKEVGAHKNQYLMVKVLYRWLSIHHIAWFLQTGEWPTQSIDHIDRNKLNNTWVNLRAASMVQQANNRQERSDKLIYSNASEHGKGIYYRIGRYEVYIIRKNIRHYLGVFYTLEEAKKAVKDFKDAE